jgi:competence protein CoiA
MKFAFVNGQRAMAESSGAEGVCPCCDGPVIAKCGKIKINHWSHLSKRHCDSWWENETDWHRNWKGHFPKDWQEVVHFSISGEKHIADVKNSQGKFFNSFLEITTIFNSPLIGRIFSLNHDGGNLIQDWGDCKAPVFFDFGDSKLLWFLLPGGDVERIVAEISKNAFIYFSLANSSSEDLITLLAAIERLATAYRIRRVGLGTEINNINAVSRQLVQAMKHPDSIIKT